MTEKAKGPSLSRILRELAETSTWHGISKIATSRQLTVKVFWCLLLVIGFCVLSYQLYALFSTFYAHPIQTTVSLEFSKLHYPAISICNMNPVRKSQISLAPELKNLFYDKKKTKQVEKRSLINTFGRNPGFFGHSGVNYHFGFRPWNVYGRYGDDFYDWDLVDQFDSEDNKKSSDISVYEYVEVEEVDSDAVAHYTGPRDKWDAVLTEFKTKFRNISADTRTQMGHQIEDFIQNFSFDGRGQNITDLFRQFTSSEYGNCYTLDNPKFKAWRSGPNHGLKLTLFLEIDEYLQKFSAAYGVRIVFHETGTLPMPAEEGLTLNAGYETNIGLRAATLLYYDLDHGSAGYYIYRSHTFGPNFYRKPYTESATVQQKLNVMINDKETLANCKQINITRLSKPHGDCVDDELFVKMYNITYSKTACQELCRIKKIVKDCGCIPYEAPDLNFGKDFRVCDQNNPTEDVCSFFVDVQFDSGSLNCKCLSPCTEFLYAKTISGNEWPHKKYLEKVLMPDMCRKDLSSLQTACEQINNDTITFNYGRYRHNFARVVIYFEDLNYEKITEEPFYTPVRFISDVGGAMGLFLGTSVLSLFELLQLILELVKYLANRNNGAGKTNVSEKKAKCAA